MKTNIGKNGLAFYASSNFAAGPAENGPRQRGENLVLTTKASSEGAGPRAARAGLALPLRRLLRRRRGTACIVVSTCNPPKEVGQRPYRIHHTENEYGQGLGTGPPKVWAGSLCFSVFFDFRQFFGTSRHQDPSRSTGFGKLCILLQKSASDVNSKTHWWSTFLST